MRNQRRSKKHISFHYILILAALLVMVTQLGWSYYHTDAQYVTINVHAGDTVWDIASAANDGKSDVRSIVYDIVKVNHLSGNDDIYPGQALQVPVNSESLLALQKRFEVK